MNTTLCNCVMYLVTVVLTIVLAIPNLASAQGQGLAFSSPVGIANGDGTSLFIADDNLDAIIRVDTASGDRVVVSDRQTGSGIPLAQPVGLTSQGGGEIFVVDRNVDAVIGVDPGSGNRRLISGCPLVQDPCQVPLVGTGLDFIDPVSITSLSPTSLLVTDIGNGRDNLIQVDVLTGNRTVISSATVGSGPNFATPLGVAVSSNGQVFVIDEALDAVVNVDIITGARTVTSGCLQTDDPCPNLVGGGPGFLRPLSIAAGTNQVLYVTDVELGAVVSVNPQTGDRTIVSDDTTGQGPVFLNPAGIAVEDSGRIVVTDAGRQAILRVDPDSGDRTILSKRANLILSPPSGVYTSRQEFDLVLIVDGLGSIDSVSVMLNQTDVTNDFLSCSEEIRLSDGGTTLQCNNANTFFSLTPGRHRFDVTLFLNQDGMSPQQFSRSVQFDILGTQ